MFRGSFYVPSSACVCSPQNTTEQNLSICISCRKSQEHILQMGFVPPDHVCPNIFIGGLASAINKHELKTRNIDRILIVTPGCCLKLFSRDFEYLQIPLESDAIEILPYLETMSDFISGAKSGVLVHDVGGSKRSAAAIIAYLEKQQLMSYENASKMVFDSRAAVYIPPIYEAQLREFSKMVDNKRRISLGFREENTNKIPAISEFQNLLEIPQNVASSKISQNIEEVRQNPLLSEKSATNIQNNLLNLREISKNDEKSEFEQKPFESEAKETPSFGIQKRTAGKFVTIDRPDIYYGNTQAKISEKRINRGVKQNDIGGIIVIPEITHEEENNTWAKKAKEIKEKSEQMTLEQNKQDKIPENIQIVKEVEESKEFSSEKQDEITDEMSKLKVKEKTNIQNLETIPEAPKIIENKEEIKKETQIIEKEKNEEKMEHDSEEIVEKAIKKKSLLKKKVIIEEIKEPEKIQAEIPKIIEKPIIPVEIQNLNKVEPIQQTIDEFLGRKTPSKLPKVPEISAQDELIRQQEFDILKYRQKSLDDFMKKKQNLSKELPSETQNLSKNVNIEEKIKNTEILESNKNEIQKPLEVTEKAIQIETIKKPIISAFIEEQPIKEIQQNPELLSAKNKNAEMKQTIIDHIRSEEEKLAKNKEENLFHKAIEALNKDNIQNIEIEKSKSDIVSYPNEAKKLIEIKPKNIEPEISLPIISQNLISQQICEEKIPQEKPIEISLKQTENPQNQPEIPLTTDKISENIQEKIAKVECLACTNEIPSKTIIPVQSTTEQQITENIQNKPEIIPTKDIIKLPEIQEKVKCLACTDEKSQPAIPLQFTNEQEISEKKQEESQTIPVVSYSQTQTEQKFEKMTDTVSQIENIRQKNIKEITIQPISRAVIPPMPDFSESSTPMEIDKQAEFKQKTQPIETKPFCQPNPPEKAKFELSLGNMNPDKNIEKSVIQYEEQKKSVQQEIISESNIVENLNSPMQIHTPIQQTVFFKYIKSIKKIPEISLIPAAEKTQNIPKIIPIQVKTLSPSKPRIWLKNISATVKAGFNSIFGRNQEMIEEAEPFD